MNEGLTQNSSAAVASLFNAVMRRHKDRFAAIETTEGGTALTNHEGDCACWARLSFSQVQTKTKGKKMDENRRAKRRRKWTPENNRVRYKGVGLKHQGKGDERTENREAL